MAGSEEGDLVSPQGSSGVASFTLVHKRAAWHKGEDGNPENLRELALGFGTLPGWVQRTTDEPAPRSWLPRGGRWS